MPTKLPLHVNGRGTSVQAAARVENAQVQQS